MKIYSIDDIHKKPKNDWGYYFFAALGGIALLFTLLYSIH
ncbi:hypothetical protein LCGC14_2232740, partial [marine sediment metagenome]